ncbi:hypothetical protein BGZ61DRAFT_233873 [Ilyonectria robusta]|uniref:uncharacterized protein n=1 Tax=Ilyonectria robusta TaxID=1079257 RepID=UPI001E8E61FD|nr:uncharacterized protein BGZ61DRAFT_233873 [Ilyonectria robusta]KAH8699577.1 hypothetical protein BGZ61DRAFT_233873 [Ilyonectria robusta]
MGKVSLTVVCTTSRNLLVAKPAQHGRPVVTQMLGLCLMSDPGSLGSPLCSSIQLRCVLRRVSLPCCLFSCISPAPVSACRRHHFPRRQQAQGYRLRCSLVGAAAGNERTRGVGMALHGGSIASSMGGEWEEGFLRRGSRAAARVRWLHPFVVAVPRRVGRFFFVGFVTLLRSMSSWGGRDVTWHNGHTGRRGGRRCDANGSLTPTTSPLRSSLALSARVSFCD